MLTPAHKFTAMRGDVELTAEVSPCCFMYGSPLQITVRLPNGGGDTIVQNKDIAIKVRIPRPSGHLFHEHPATDSTVIRPPIPRSSGHP